MEEKHINMHSPSLSIIGSKIKEKIDLKNVWNLLNNTFQRKIRTIVGPSISGIECDRDKPIFSSERGGLSDRDEA